MKEIKSVQYIPTGEETSRHTWNTGIRILMMMKTMEDGDGDKVQSRAVRILKEKDAE